jgi:hypothetical protein
MPFYLPIPRGTHHVAKATATVPRFVMCEECGHGYGYWLTRTGYGHAYEHWGFIPAERLDRFVTDAEVEVEQKLKTACEAVPCPECGWYQRHMRDRAREERYGWLLWAGIGAAIVGVFLLMSLGGMAAMVVEKYLHNGAIVLVMRAFLLLALPLAVLMPVGVCLLRVQSPVLVSEGPISDTPLFRVCSRSPLCKLVLSGPGAEGMPPLKTRLA